MSKLWGGRFTGKTDPVMERFNLSLDVDKVMWAADIDGSIGYSRALQKAGVITAEEGEAIRSGLVAVRAEWAAGTFEVKPGDEDIHTANERRLTELVGAVGGKVHTGRSRNDQVVTDLRMHLRGVCARLGELVRNLVRTAAKRAAAEADILMPGYTHLQSAQPVRWGHWMLAHAASWRRDGERLAQIAERMNECPLGSGALAGNPFGIDREALAADLGFARPTANSIDGVTDRDFVVELTFWCSLLMTHLSKYGEDLIIFSTQEFGFVRLSDAYSTGSSLMPQKKNPDALELLRGKSGRTIGHLVSLLTMLKGLPTAYNKDMQEDKQALFDALDTAEAGLQIADGVLATLTPQPDRMRAALNSFMLATDLSEYLVRKGVPFRETHHISGRAVQLAEQRGCSLFALTLEDLKGLHPLFTEDVMSVWDFDAAAERRDSTGGTSKRSVLEQAKQLELWAGSDIPTAPPAAPAEPVFDLKALKEQEAAEMKKKIEENALKAKQKEKEEDERIAKMQALEAQGVKVAGGMHKFDASEVDVHGGNATADDFLDAFGM